MEAEEYIKKPAPVLRRGPVDTTGKRRGVSFMRKADLLHWVVRYAMSALSENSNRRIARDLKPSDAKVYAFSCRIACVLRCPSESVVYTGREGRL